MSTTEWSLLCVLDLRHGYYANDIWQDAEIEPSETTALMFQRYGCRLRKTAAGAEIWYQTSNGVAPLKSIPAETSLGFILSSSTQYFHTFTQTADAGMEDVLVFRDTQTASTGALGMDARFFSPPAGVGMPVKSADFQQSFRTPRAAQQVSVVGASDGVIYWQEPNRQTAFKSLALKLTGVPEGLYSLRFDHDSVMDFVLLNTPNAVGYISLTPAGKDIPPTQRMVLDGNTIQPQTLMLKLEPRTSIWRYVVSGLPDQAATITTKEGGDTFTSPKPLQVTGRAAVEFMSKAALPLRQSQTARDSFALTFNDHNGVPAKIALPIASPQTTRMEQTSLGNQLVSTMYVNI